MRSKKILKKSANAFTLVESLITLAIVAILIILVVYMMGKLSSMSKRAAGTADLRNIGLAMHQYANDHNGEFPFYQQGTGPVSSTVRVNSSGVSKSLPEKLIPNYVPNTDIFIAPADKIRRGSRDPETGWASHPDDSRFMFCSYYFYYMNPNPSTIHSDHARPMKEGGYGPIWSVRSPPSKVLANSVYYDHLFPVYPDGTMVLRVNGSVQWYNNETFRRDRSIINQFDQRDE